MRKTLIKLLSPLMFFILTIAFLLPTKTYASTSNINYVALGDSIATGTLLSSMKIDSYVKYFSDYLKSTTTGTVTVKNLSHDGDRSNELLALLTSNPTTNASAKAVQDAVKTANIITISIGGNNLMQATNIPGFSSINTSKASQGVTDFLTQWPLIIKAIQAFNPNVQIIANTQYNPFNTIGLSGYRNDPALHSQVDTYITPINQCIVNNSTTLHYSVANVHDTFHPFAVQGKMGSYTYFYPIFSYLRNPHPNASGQKLITEIIKKVYSPLP